MENDEHFRRAFMFFDKDGSGYIELDELQEALADESGEADVDVLNDIMREVDTDKVWLPSQTNSYCFLCSGWLLFCDNFLFHKYHFHGA